VASPAFAQWQTVGLPRPDELERLHAAARGTGPGRRWGMELLNCSLFVALIAQFQTYCRDLHDGAIEVHVRSATAHRSGSWCDRW
jgi:hypothetical protein